MNYSKCKLLKNQGVLYQKVSSKEEEEEEEKYNKGPRKNKKTRQYNTGHDRTEHDMTLTDNHRYAVTLLLVESNMSAAIALLFTKFRN